MRKFQNSVKEQAAETVEVKPSTRPVSHDRSTSHAVSKLIGWIKPEDDRHLKVDLPLCGCSSHIPLYIRMGHWYIRHILETVAISPEMTAKANMCWRS